jgi:hypothetical protein
MPRETVGRNIRLRLRLRLRIREIRDQSQMSERFFVEIGQTDVVEKFNLSAVIIDCNCK